MRRPEEVEEEAAAAVELRTPWAAAECMSAVAVHPIWAAVASAVVAHVSAARPISAAEARASVARPISAVVARVSAVRLTLAARVLAAGLRYRGLRRGQVHTRVSEVSARLRIMAFRTGAPAAAQR